MDEVTAEGMRSWLAGVPTGPSVKNRALNVVKRALQHAVDLELLDKNPAERVRRARYRPKETPYLPPGEVRRYLDAMRGIPTKPSS